MTSIKYMNEILLALITAAAVGLTALFNDVNIHIRLREIRIFLQNSNRDENNLDHIGLVMKYRQQKELYENRITDENISITESRVNSILSSGDKTEQDARDEKYSYLTIPVLYSINLIRRVIGIPAIGEMKENEINLKLEAAYYYERNKDYKKAIDFYDQLLGENAAERHLVAGMILHQGFCYSIIGDYKIARTKYLKIINDYGDTNAAPTAAMLLKYLEGFKAEIDRIINTEKDSPEKAEKLFKLIAYSESLEILKRIEKTATPSDLKKILYLKGRSLEEAGESDRALEIYQQIIKDNPKSGYAASANRRIFIVGSLIQDGDKIKKISIENNKVIKDDTLEKMADEETKFQTEEKKLNVNDESRDDHNSLISNIVAGNVKSALESASINEMMKKAEAQAKKKRTKIEKPHTEDEINVKVFAEEGTISLEEWLKKKQEQKHE